MSRVLITGSGGGLGLLAGRLLAADGHQATLHARDWAKARRTEEAVPQAETVVVGDLSSLRRRRARHDADAAVVPDRGRSPGPVPTGLPTPDDRPTPGPATSTVPGRTDGPTRTG